MNEEALFNAYRNINRVIEDELNRGGEPDYIRSGGSMKCVVPECPTMIAFYTGRTMCRYHVGKRKRGEK